MADKLTRCERILQRDGCRDWYTVDVHVVKGDIAPVWVHFVHIYSGKKMRFEMTRREAKKLAKQLLG